MKSLVFRPRIGKIAYVILLPALYIYGKTSRPRARVIIRHGDEILFVKNWLSWQEWSLPGGGVGRGETAKQAAIREVREETGIVLQSALVDLGIHPSPSRQAPYKIAVFCIDIETKPEVCIDQKEIVEHRWIHRDDFDTALHPNLAKLVARAS